MSIKRLIVRIKLYFYPPEKWDSYYGDPFDFVIANRMEQILHGMKNKNGDALWSTVPSDRCYRLTVESACMPSYYRCTSEVLVSNVNNPSEKKWLKRVQPRRILKDVFHQMIVDGKIEKFE